jgi:cysteine desulfurase
MRRIYVDHAATTPVHPKVAEAMLANMTGNWGNPSSIHSFGRAARKAVEEAREQVAALIGCRTSELFFTSGGTEADNWALRGAAYANLARGKHLITTSFEHHAILDAMEQLGKEGFEVTVLPVEPGTGLLAPEVLAAAVRPDTTVISIMWANNEVGTVQDLPALVAAAKAVNPNVIFHTDAVQAVGNIPVNVKEAGVDMLTCSSHKIYGPKGVGALYMKKGFRFQAMQYGGGQERKLRPGTENVPGVIGFGVAAALAKEELAARQEHMRSLRDRFWLGLQQRVERIHLNGPDPIAMPERRLPGNLNVSVAGVEGEALLLGLDMKGVACSSGSACSSGAVEPSHVLQAIGTPRDLATASLRFSFGQANQPDDVDLLLDAVEQVVNRLRGMARV